MRGKGNYSRRPPAIEFLLASRTLELNGHRFDVSTVDDLRESDMTVEQVLGQPREGLTKADHGGRLLTDELADGEWHKAADLVALLEEAGIADRDATTRERVGVERKKSEGFPRIRCGASLARAHTWERRFTCLAGPATLWTTYRLDRLQR